VLRALFTAVVALIILALTGPHSIKRRVEDIYKFIGRIG